LPTKRRASCALGALAWGFAACAIADDLTVLSAAAVEVPVTEAAAQFTRETGQRVTFEFATAGQVDERLGAGARPDIVISSSGRIAARTSENPTDAASVRDLGTVRIGVAARKGAPRPDLSSVAKFREALVRAESVAYGDPARGATTGIHFSRIVEQLDLRGVLAARTILAANGLDVVEKVARGEAELGITQVSEILHVDAAAYVGPLPDALQLATTYAAWIPDSANTNARLFVEAMTNRQGRERFRAAGFD
jgi:molybdate transport system substrate-binding protein